MNWNCEVASCHLHLLTEFPFRLSTFSYIFYLEFTVKAKWEHTIKSQNIIISIESVKVVYIVLYEIKRSVICTARIWKCARDRLRCSWFSKHPFLLSEKKYQRRSFSTLLAFEPQPLFMATRDQKKKKLLLHVARSSSQTVVVEPLVFYYLLSKTKKILAQLV